MSKSGEFANVFGIGGVFILIAEKDGFAYCGLEGSCTWDEEHGIGFLLHKDRVVHIGGADISFRSFEAYKDNGTFDAKEEERKRLSKIELPKPIFYKPHPKYGTLKPLQHSENEMYENRLAERGYNDEFIKLVKSGRIDINLNKGLSMTFLQRASQFNNVELCQYLFNQKPKDETGVIQNAAGNLSKELVELCLRQGIDINEKNNVNQTLFQRTKGQLNYWKAKDEIDKAKLYEDFLDFIVSLGATE